MKLPVLCWMRISYKYFLMSRQKLLYGSCRTGELRLPGKYIRHRLLVRLETDNTFKTDSIHRLSEVMCDFFMPIKCITLSQL